MTKPIGKPVATSEAGAAASVVGAVVGLVVVAAGGDWLEAGVLGVEDGSAAASAAVKLNVPSIGWESEDTTRQVTVYSPAGVSGWSA
jgi:hypothetical protein